MRLFLAITLPEAMQSAIAREVAPARAAAPAVRWVRPELMHLTVKFLGERPEEDEARVARATRAALAPLPPFEVTVGGTGAFPNFRRPRVVWLGMHPPTPLAGLARRLDAALAPLGVTPETRPFRAHVTLGRVADGVPRQQVAALERALRAVRATWPLAIREVALMRSTLGAGGPHHDRLHHFALEGS